MKKYVLSFLLTILVLSFSHSLAWFTDSSEVKYYFGIHSPVEQYFTVEVEDREFQFLPGIEFLTEQNLNENFRLLVEGHFYNEADFGKLSDDTTTDSTITSWDYIIDSIDAILGWKASPKVHFGFSLGGGVYIEQYNKSVVQDASGGTDIIETQACGYGYLKTGFGFKLRSPLFLDKLAYVFGDQFFEFHMNGNGSLGVEDYSFGDSLYHWNKVKLSTTTNTSSGQSSFKFFGFKTNGIFGFGVPLNKLVRSLSRFHQFLFKLEVTNQIGFRGYSKYEYYYNSKLEAYNIKTHFEPTGGGIFLGLVCAPIKEVEITVSYQMDFTAKFTEWTNYSGVELKNYDFLFKHYVEAFGYFKFPKVVGLKLGVGYTIDHNFDYQYENDGNVLKETIFTKSVSQGYNTFDDYVDNKIRHVVSPICVLDFNIVSKNNVHTVLTLGWFPKFVLYSSSEDDTYSLYKSVLDANGINLACWRIDLLIKFNPYRISFQNDI